MTEPEVNDIDSNEQPQLRVGSHVLVQLGSELVTDVEQAILECVKNSYDADSPGCQITIDTREEGYIQNTGSASDLSRFIVPAENVLVSLFQKDGKPIDVNTISADEEAIRRLDYVGSISIEDTGNGLSEEQLKNTWLVISGSQKRSLSGPKMKTALGRTPLGDKGVGRLGTMRLGDILVIETSKSPMEKIAKAVFRWGDCDVADTVDQIPVSITSIENTKGFKGTKVSVLGLRDISEWRKPSRGSTIARSMASLISPFEVTSSFPVSISLDGADHSLVAVTNEILSKAVAKFDFKWSHHDDGQVRLKANAYFRKNLFNSTQTKSQKRRTEIAFGKDGGRGFHQALSKIPRTRGYVIEPYNAGAAWFIELEQSFDWAEVVVGQDEAVEDPGPFTGSFYFFSLKDFESNRDAAVTGTTATRQLIKEISGITILRDGFRVRSPGDWLNMASESTSGSSYGLRPENTLGYFELTGEHNFLLTEKSDREGFVENPPYRGFLQIAQTCRKFATDSMESFRRAAIAYADNLEEQEAQKTGRPVDPIVHLQKTLADTAGVRDLVIKQASSLHRDLADLNIKSVDEDTAKALRLANTAMSAIEQVKDKLSPTVEQIDSLRRVREDIDDQRDQVVSLFESAAVGLSARGLAHEVRTHLTEIRQQTKALQKASERGTSLQPMLRSIRGSCSAISSAAALIDPMLPRTRAIKEQINLGDFINEYIAGRKLSMERYEIRAVVSPNVSTTVRMNRSRLLQVVDNMVQNSIYWLRNSNLNDHASPERTINFEVLPTGLAIWDTGPGVNEKVEESLFEMFVSTKLDSRAGQGLGLFIVSQLLEIDGCSASLSEERNSRGKRFKFLVDLSSVLSGDGQK
ncbi:sensor histidine kinase [Leisingera daeponensis]|uniref:sensor histidine kinase n=1 Tax=Leisingera daeponensis TaxID=405746 RepID=UPI000422F3E3|nr:sensor histidine kinase [Leisingera daeponensis]